MLQRAASNAYSWWWASHIRTKQSKWLEQNLQDMGEKVQNMLTLIEEDGDSFAKRAEMYYKKRPELINFVEESYRAYRALAERYDHISTELQNANNTIASVFPEQVQFAIDEEDEDDSPKIQKKFPEVSKLNIPKVPKIPSGDIKGLLTLTSKKLQPQKSKRAITINTVAKSGLSKPEALEEIDKLQKGILTLQTEKEFVKSSYEGGLAKYWEIEKQITDMQEKICSFQDEFGAGKVIEDHEARTLMAAAALKSCQQTLNRLQEKQERSAKEAIAEYQRIKDARVKFESIKYEFLRNKIDQEKAYDKDESVEADKKLQSVDQEVDSVTEENQELGSLREKIKEHFEVVSNTSLTVTEMAEKIDELVSKVIGLESAVSSQTALIKRLRTETDELQAQIRSLEDDKVTLIGGTNNLSNKLREMEEKLRGIQDLNQNVENQNINLQTHFTEARCNLDHLSEKLHAVKPDEELEVTGSVQGEKGSLVEVKSQKELEDQKDTLNPGDGFKNSKDVKIEVKEDRKEDDLSTVKTQKGEKQEEEEEEVSQSRTTNDDPDNLSEKSQDPKPQGIVHKQDLSQTVDSLLKTEPQEQATEQEDEPNWQQLFLNGLEDREKILLAEYTTILRSFKEVKKKLGEVEKKNGDSLFETTVQIRKLKVANAMKDEEIQSLRQTLNVLRTSSDGNEDLKEYKDLDYQPTSSLLDDQKVEPTARTEELTATETPKLPPTENEEEEEEEEDIKVILVDQPQAVSAIEEMFRMNIDELLEENLDFWLRFSSSFHQIQKFQTGIQDLQAEISKLKEKEKKQQEGSTTTEPSLKSDARPLYKHLREIQTELTVWIEQSALLKDELQCRFSSLCNIQEEISRALKAGSEDEEIKFTSYQAARFQGEVLNMKQENNKVADELQAGLDHVTVLQLEVEKTLEKLNEKFGLSGSENDHHFQMQHSTSRSRVPLRSFIFGVKQKKQKPSIFSCMNPTLQRKYHDLRAGLPM